MLRNLKTSSLWLAALLAASSAAQACEESVPGPAGVTQVYPNADVLPENLLRFYVYFSEPMAREGIWDSVVLLDEDGKVVPGAFIENKFDLWSPDDRRLTVLFDPGRVKTGLVAHNKLGRALEPGKTYTLQVRNSAETRSGCTLTRSYKKTFVAAKADFEAPDLAKWQVQAPMADSTEPLLVTLNGPMDHVSLAYRVRVTDETGAKLGGSLRLGPDEREWIFTPRDPWANANYRIEVDTTLEDIAGNRLTGLFDRPLDSDGYSQPGQKTESLTFKPRNN
ncbi:MULTISPECIES: Ig-like domain-containing protein [unclassified Ruegeria]|uniref:Ig-like domain-containing protein n=1 Tax=unclassified Ruegeria TaxID=2625375 RepID=UPI001488F065|nr:MULTISPECIES: Ig-like domain-containing protein [unclassified Ruegeria]NOD85959.1 hypothetical protein [Ruegeria sp. HKCCD6119]